MSADYEEFARGLAASSTEANKMDIPQSIYTLDSSEATAFFRQYFQERKLTPALRVNVGYPIFHWGNNRSVLQHALVDVFIGHLDEFFIADDDPSAARVAADDNELHNHYFSMLVFLVDILRFGSMRFDEKASIAARLFKTLDASPYAEGRRDTSNACWNAPSLGFLKTQFLLTCFSYAIVCDRVDDLIRLLPLPSNRISLLDSYGVFIADGGALNDIQIAAISAFLEAIPAQLHHPRSVTCYDGLVAGLPSQPPVTVHDFATLNGFNISNVTLGTAPENSFPPDYHSVETDCFMIVFAHEFSHGVDVAQIESHTSLKQVKLAALAAAGDEPANYLRSMLRRQYFSDNPQEFFASIANMYFTSSDDTLEYALQKAQAGQYDQITQFVLIASTYSDNNNSFFYRLDTNGIITMRKCPVEKIDNLIQILRRPEPIEFTFRDGLVIDVRVAARN